MADRLEYFAFFRKSTSLYRAYNVKVTIMLVDMADFFIKQNKKSNSIGVKVPKLKKLYRNDSF